MNSFIANLELSWLQL